MDELQPTQQESLEMMQAMWRTSTRQVGVLVANDSGIVWSTKDKEPLCLFLETKEESPEAWVSVRGGMRIFALYFWHSEEWTPRYEALMEAVVEQVSTTRHPGWWHVMPTWTRKISDGVLWFKEKCTVSLVRRKHEFPVVGPQAQNGDIIAKNV